MRAGGYGYCNLHNLRQKLLESADSDDVTNQYPWLIRSTFKQKLDHFNPTNTETWDQRYYYNPKYARNTSIIFFMIGGEGPEDGKWAAKPDIQYLQWAQEFGAHVFDLEHRFFGDSWPKPNMNFDSLSLLTTEQALADLAYFITSMNQQYGFNNPRWVTFGGSYPEYAQVVQDDLTITSKDCPGYVQQAFQNMEDLSKSLSGRQKLNTYFNLQPPFDANTTALDITNFFANVYSVFQSMTQYTYDGRNAESEKNLTDAKLCQFMMDSTVPDVITRVYNVYLWYNDITGDPSTDLTVFPNSYSDMINSVGTGDLKQLGEDNGKQYILK
ncbi:serine carboxypeptidase S28 [Oesophagostomum dentatum]|uniref:Serine carboxypeptidase S28 n=1 Tax=Oesophagostomum dentatum TaxID=61180 RepID=A0A0B1TBI5_OESDE|nr:serine carboxypeptidase S28 [Oesophagostomum dentatum]